VPINVPTYGGPGQVKEQGGPNIRFNPNVPEGTFGEGRAAAGVAKATNAIFDTTRKIVEEEKQRADETAFMVADREASELQTALEVETKGIRGKDAGGAPDAIGAKWTKGVEAIRERLTSRRQREAFDRAVTNRWESLNKNVQFHVSNELTTYETNESKAHITASKNAAILNAGDDERITQEVDRQRAAFSMLARTAGIPKDSDQYKTELTKVLSETHREVIASRLGAEQEDQAAVYFEKAKAAGEFTDDDLLKVQKAIDEGKVLGKSRRLAEEILGSTKSMQEALAKAKSIKETKVYDKTVDRIKEEYSLRNTAEEADGKARFNRAALFAEKNKKRPDGVTWHALTLQDRNAIDARIKQLRTGEEPTTNWQLYYKLERFAGDATMRDSFVKTDLYKHRAELADAEFKYLSKLQSEIARGDEKTVQKLDGIFTKTSIVDGVLKEAGIDPTAEEGSDAATQANRFRKMVDAEVMQKQSLDGKPVNNEEVREISERLMRKTITEKGRFWDTEKPIYELELRDIPADERSKIEEALRALGRETSDRNVLHLFRLKRSRDAGKQQ
jgi:hypothetical protein